MSQGPAAPQTAPTIAGEPVSRSNPMPTASVFSWFEFGKFVNATILTIVASGGFLAIWGGGAVNVKPSEPVPVVPVAAPVAPAKSAPVVPVAVPVPATADDIAKINKRLDEIAEQLAKPSIPKIKP